jgi:hypothetical protein
MNEFIAKLIKSLAPVSKVTNDFKQERANAMPMQMGAPAQGAFDDVQRVGAEDYPASTAQPIAQSPQASPQAMAQAIWRAKYQDIWEREFKKRGLPPEAIKLLVMSENGQENPGLEMPNVDKKTGKVNSVDVGLGQVNVDPNNRAEIERLKNPDYNVSRSADIYQGRLKNLEDPLLAFASYNKGAGGAVLDPEGSLKRATDLYNHAGVPIPENDFKKDPSGYVKKRMDMYKSMGLFK